MKDFNAKCFGVQNVKESAGENMSKYKWYDRDCQWISRPTKQSILNSFIGSLCKVKL